jgi:hypothetical protein
MQNLAFSGCRGLTGDIGTLVHSEGMQCLYIDCCDDLIGQAKG